jgi:hypothetical protein
MAEHQHRVRPHRGLVAVAEGPAAGRVHAEGGEVVGGDRHPARRRVLAAVVAGGPGDDGAHPEAVLRRQVRELGRARAQPFVERIGERPHDAVAHRWTAIGAAGTQAVAEEDQPLGLPHRQLAQHQGVDHAEDRAIGADPQRQADHHHGHQPRAAPQRAQSVAQIEDQVAQHRRVG